MNEISELVQNIDLLALIEKDLGPGKKSGRWILFSCPFPGHAHGDKNPSLSVTADNGRFFCFSCKKAGDAYTWLREYRRLDHRAALEVLGGGALPAFTGPRPALPPPEPTHPPADPWQRAALALVESCERELWEPGGARALAWLREKRGLTDKTIKRFRLGYNPALTRPPAASWGTPGENTDPLYIPRGIVIPGLVDCVCWYIKIRQPAGEPKYINVRGGRPALFGADTLTGADTILLTEGEFDAILAWQELKEYCGVATLGSATKKLDLALWGRYLFLARLILAAYDLDKAGAAGLATLAGQSKRVHSLPIPRLRAEDKDITDYWRAGGNLVDWLNYHLDRLDPQPGGVLAAAVELGAIVKPYGEVLLDASDRAEQEGNRAESIKLLAAAMIEMGVEPEDGIPWEQWAAENMPA